MAFEGLIDAITGPSFKLPDGSSKTSTLSDLGSVLKDEATQTTTYVIESAKDTIMSKFLPGLKRVVDKIAPTAIAASATLQHTGGQGSFVEYLQPAYLYSNFIYLEDDRHAFIGWPCHQILTLGNVSGFTLCENVQIEAAGATVEELEIIKQFLESGVYIE